MKRGIIALTLFLCSFPGFCDVLVYKKNIEDEERRVECRIEPAGNGWGLTVSEVTVSEGDKKGNIQKLKCELDSSFSIVTLEYSNSDPEEEAEIFAKRSGNTIEIKGFSEGKEINKNKKLGSLPWYEPTFGLHAFAASRNKSITYWVAMVHVGDMVAKFSAVKEETETLLINGKQLEAEHVKVSIKHIMAALMGSVDYWFRKSDGRLLRYYAEKGPGGKPITLELVSED